MTSRPKRSPKKPRTKTCAIALCPFDPSQAKFHKFPKDEKLQRKWRQLTKRTDKRNMDHRYVCSNHFAAADYRQDAISHLYPPRHNLLKPGAFPSQHLPPGNDNSEVRDKLSSRALRAVVRSHLSLDKDLRTLANFLPQEPLNVATNGGGVAMDCNPEKPVSHDAMNGSIGPIVVAADQSVQCDLMTQSGVPAQSKDDHSDLANQSLRRRLQIERRNNQKLRKEILTLRSDRYKKKLMKEELDKVYSPAQTRLIMGEKMTRLRNFSEEDVETALILKSFSPKCYEYLRSKKLLALPCPTTLANWAKGFKCLPGVQLEILHVLKHKLSLLPSEHRKLAAISFEEMDLRKGTEPTSRSKTILGPGKKLQVALLRGITHSWEQIVFFHFDTCMRKSIFDDIVQLAEEVSGVEICSVAFDFGNEQFLSDYKLNEETYWIPNPTNPERKIYAFPRPPHLLKLCRNHILDVGLSLPPDFGKKLTRQDFQLLLDAKCKEFKVDLQKIHIACSQKERKRVHLATELLSESTAKAMSCLMVDNERQSKTVELIHRWFEIMNTNFLSDTDEFKCAFGVHIENQRQALWDMQNLISNNHAVGKSKLKPWQKGILMSVHSLLDLFQNLQDKYGLSFIMTSRLGQDSLLDFFSQIRGLGGYNSHPTAVDALRRLRALIISREAKLLVRNPAAGNDVQTVRGNELEQLAAAVNEDPTDESVGGTVIIDESADGTVIIEQSSTQAFRESSNANENAVESDPDFF